MSPPITIRGIKNTPLDPQAYESVVRRYWRDGLRRRKPVVIRFRKLNGVYGMCTADKAGHTISIDYSRCGLELVTTGMDLDRGTFGGVVRALSENDWTANLISVTVHELRHAMQYEDSPRRWHSARYDHHERCDTSRIGNHYSECELDARSYEYKHAGRALDYYWELKERR